MLNKSGEITEPYAIPVLGQSSFEEEYN